MTRDDLDEWPTGRLLSTAARLMEHSWERTLADFGISSAGLVVLHVLAGGPATQRQIARASQVTDQTASRTIERLEGTGHLTRQVDPRDERRRLVTITDEGLATYRTLLDIEREAPSLFAPIGDSEATLRRLLLDLIRAQRESEAARHGREATSAPE